MLLGLYAFCCSESLLSAKSSALARAVEMQFLQAFYKADTDQTPQQRLGNLAEARSNLVRQSHVPNSVAVFDAFLDTFAPRR